jgi:phospholipid/cholesterol/gamma-HCH transport system substrate-binding protein
METRASYATIGLFTMVVIALAFGFIYWLKRTDGTGERANLPMEFQGTVNGLASGADVFFNGIKVGAVTNLGFSPSDSNIVEVMTSIRKDTPIKSDSQTRISFNILTGVAYVEIFGGSPSAPSIFTSATPVKLVGQPPAGDLMPALGRAAGQIDAAVSRLNAFLDDVQPSVKKSIVNIEKFTDALGDNAGQVKDVMASIGELSKTVSGVSNRINAITDAIDPNKVRSIVENTDRVTRDASKFSSRGLDELTAAIVDFRRTVSQIDRIASSLEKNPQSLIFGSEGNIRTYNRK